MSVPSVQSETAEAKARLTFPGNVLTSVLGGCFLGGSLTVHWRVAVPNLPCPLLSPAFPLTHPGLILAPPCLCPVSLPRTHGQQPSH